MREAWIRAVGLTLGMYIQFIYPFQINETVALMMYILGGMILWISFAIFVLMTFKVEISRSTVNLRFYLFYLKYKNRIHQTLPPNRLLLY